MRFRKTRRGVEATPDEVETAVLRRCVQDLLTLLGGAEAAPRDPLEALVGMPTGDPVRPEDPAMARLLPDAYGDDPEASREFRRYTDADLRATKRAHCGTVLQSLPEQGKVQLDRDQADAWLVCLNDLRLVLGTRLEVSEDLHELPEDDPRQASMQLYGWLGWLQESLLGCLTPRR